MCMMLSMLTSARRNLLGRRARVAHHLSWKIPSLESPDELVERVVCCLLLSPQTPGALAPPRFCPLLQLRLRIGNLPSDFGCSLASCVELLCGGCRRVVDLDAVNDLVHA